MEEISAYPGLDTPAEGAAVEIARELAASDAAPLTLAFGTEAGLYAQAGIPTVVCGPGDISRAHKADEWIGLDELAAAGRMMQRLADRLSQVPEIAARLYGRIVNHIIKGAMPRCWAA